MPPSDLLERLHPSVRETFIPLEGADIKLHLPGDAAAVARDILASLAHRPAGSNAKASPAQEHTPAPELVQESA